MNEFIGEVNLGPLAVLRADFEDWNFLKVGQVFENCLGLHALDAKQLARRGPGILAEGLTQNQAKHLAEELREVGATTIIVPCRDLLDLPMEFPARSVEFSTGRLVFHGEDDRKTQEIWPQRVFGICAARLFRVESITNATSARTLSYGMGYGGLRVREVTITSRGSKESWPPVLSLFQTEPFEQIRIYGDKFNYQFLGRNIIERSDEAFVEFLGLLIQQCPNAALNRGAKDFLAEEGLPKWLNFDKERLFEEHAHWFVQTALCEKG